MLKERKLCTCFVDLDKAFGRPPRKVLELSKKGMLDVLVTSVMSV